MRPNEKFRPGFWTYLFFLILAAGGVVTILRYWKGLGAVTNLSDSYPWGLWVGFDVLCGVGLAAGGFAITTAVYVFNLKRFKPIVRPTVLISRAVDRVPASLLSLVLLLQPVFAYVWDVAFFDRGFTAAELGGAALALAAIQLGAARRAR